MNLSASPFRALRAAVPLIVLSPAAAPALAPQEQAAEVVDEERVLRLSLEDALRIALQNNLGLEAQVLEAEIAELETLGAWGSFDPVLTIVGTASEQERQGQSQLSGGAVVQDDQLGLDATLAVPLETGGTISLRFDRSNDKTNNQFATFDVSTTDVLTLALTQPLLKGGWRRYATSQQRLQEIERDRQRQLERQTRQQLLLEVYGAYWDLVSAIEELGVRTLAVERGETQLQQDQRRLELGAGTEVDVLQSETNVAQQSERLLNAQFLLRQAEDTVRHLLFRKPSEGMEEFLHEWDWPIEPLTSLPDAEPVSLDWRGSLQRAIEARPELWQRRLDVDASDLRLDLARSDWLPQLDLDLSTSGAGFDPDPGDAFETAYQRDFPSSSASLTFSLPLLNRTARYGLNAARARLRAARLAFDQLELDILSEVRAAVRDVEYRAEAVLAAEKSAALARRQLEAEQVRMEIGLSTTFQVLEFQETLAEARSTEVTARAAYAKALVKLEHAEGTLELGADAGDER